ncbi:leucine--tRNA ligase [Jatrophihabitans lederbergiae]|uniref:Leucine--tRNA ligase n=1 Tax=Jatrophihabitans lederbergiae TaxID=3075547 RepID=A0ABU2J5W4_9ACTN|nr:leucine--tRNA ligase [Jatrophihabitans sp. DSM 44399]MDT0260382.1 leucine--tRNA ligase [Jatrophihabitans sp. DSM 44399]
MTATHANDAADIPPFRYSAALANELESRWQQEWAERGTFNAPNPIGELSTGFERVAGKPHTFVMDMFPYPSGAGLHVGHPLGYIGTDVYARYLRMRGENVLHTMGFDAFGLPAEQYALQTGQHPATTTNKNIEVFKRQLRALGLGHDQRRVISTTDPEFYRWTQWIFLQLFNSFYDSDADNGVGRARPISELISDLNAGRREPDEGANDFGLPWSDLDESQRRTVIDRHRLAYVSKLPVNWCPGLGTVLANEEVTADGRSERGNFPVFRKPLAQWMLRITAYADRLLADLDYIDWPEKVRTMQKNWIGRSIGAHVHFATESGDITVFTTRPDTLFGATYMVLAPEHPMVADLTAVSWPEGTEQEWTGGYPDPAAAVAAYQREAAAKTDLDRQGADAKAKTGVFIGAFAINPVTGARLPVFIADYVLMGYGTGAIMAVPAQDERDWEFAEAFKLPIIRTVQPPESFARKAFLGDGPAMKSANDEVDLNGLGVNEAKARIIEYLERSGRGRGATTYRLRDWLFSRQRYWGEPFPIVYDENNQPIALPDSMLPLRLPETNDFTPKSYPPDDVDSDPEPPLGRLTDWVNVELDLGDGLKSYRRETNTMPNWAGSCWYELRYLDPANDDALVDKQVENYWMGPTEERPLGGVDLYVGGVEHAVLHLLYSRFWHKVLFDLGHVSSAEPFHRLVNQGMLQLPAYTNADGFYVEAAEVTEADGAFLFEGQQVQREFGKIGKSLKNVVAPDQFVADFGTDTFRLFEMFSGPLDQSRPWDAKAIVGPYRLLQRIWRVVLDEQTGRPHVADMDVPDELNRLLHKTISAVRDGYETLRFNTSIARITELNNTVTQLYPDGGAPRAVAEALTLMLAPLAPHAAEELWSKLGHAESLAWQEFPVVDEGLLVDDTIEVPVQVNGKVRSVIHVAADADAAAMEAAARAEDKVLSALADRPVKRVIAVPGRLVNFVV